MMSLPRSLSILLAAVVLVALGFAGLAARVAAAPHERVHYSGTDSGDFNCDGLLDMHVEVTFSGVFMLKQGRAGDPTPYFFDNYQFLSVFTAVPDTGRWLTIEGNALYKDLRITNVSGTLYTFEAVNVGQPIILRDMHGNVLFRDRGRLLFRFVVDTQGDTDLSNDVFIEDSWELLAENGAHPWFYYPEGCQLAADLLL